MALWKRRKFLCVLALTIAGVLVIVAALPLWFPWVLRPAAKHLGATYAQYQREGYQRFRLTGFAFTNSYGRFEAKQVEAYVPTVWLWRCLVGSTSAPFLQMDSWNWKSRAASVTPLTPSAQSASAYPVVERAVSRLKMIEKWLPRMEWTHGNCQLKAETLQIPRAVWADKELSARVSVPRIKGAFHLHLAAQSVAPLKLKLTLNAAGLQFNSRFTIAAVEHQLNIQGTAFWLSNRIELSARLPERGFVPETASLRADSFQIPSRLFKLEHYRNLNGSLSANWQTNRFKLRLAAKMLPQSANWPPIQMNVLASGTAHSMQLDAARISSRWLEAVLSRRTHILFKPPYLTQPATLDVTANLGQQLWVAARGKLAGKAVLRPRAGLFPQVSFALDGTGLSMSNITAKALHLEGDIQWPLTNSATLSLEDLKIPRVRPLRVEADWHARGMDLEQMQVGLSAGKAALRIRGAAELGGSKKKLNVTALELSCSNQTELHLQQPFEATFQSMAPTSSNSWLLTLQPVVLSGEGGGLQLAASTAWPQTGFFHISGQSLNSSLIRDFIQGSTPEAGLGHLTFAGGWTNGPIAFRLHSIAEWKAKGKFPFEINAETSGGGQGISISNLSVTSATQTVCRVEGRLPITLEPGAANGFIRINPDGALRLYAATQTNSMLWKEIADAGGGLLAEPRLKAWIEGTWAEPRGRITFQAQRVRFPRIKHPLPTLEQIDLAAEVSRGEARISQFHFLIDGQPVQFTAQMPLQRRFWSTLVSQRTLPDWHKATVHLKIENARLAPFVDLVPGMLSPQGALRADLTLQPGGALKGELAITNAATLPLPNLGAVRNIQAKVHFTGQTADLTDFSAAIGGQTVTADGRMPLSERIWSHHAMPPFAIHLRGTNVPLIRKSSLLLRADLDLALTNPATGPGILAGQVTLRDSLFLANLQSLVPENTSTPKEHPPYFSVTARPWAAWHLNLQVHGDQFMRVQTPVFRGIVSAAMRLQNTLENPLALGEIRISSGAVTFPFGSLKVDQGFVSLTSDNPYHPRLFLTAQAQQFGYNVKLEVTGTAENPIVQFSSTPPLSSQQIVMMLTTGQLPAGMGVTTSTLQRAEGLGVFFGKNLLSEFGFEPGLQNQLTFHTGQQISETGRPTYEANYRLSKRWSIAGEYDRFDQYNLNLKWNIYSK